MKNLQTNSTPRTPQFNLELHTSNGIVEAVLAFLGESHIWAMSVAIMFLKNHDEYAAFLKKS